MPEITWRKIDRPEQLRTGEAGYTGTGACYIRMAGGGIIQLGGSVTGPTLGGGVSGSSSVSSGGGVSLDGVENGVLRSAGETLYGASTTDHLPEGGNLYLSAANLAANLAAVTHAATGKDTPVDADELPLADSADTYALKKLTWANLKATAKAYFDTLYAAVAHVHSIYAELLGRSGGQTLNGGTGAGENLVLSSTAHATKGVVEIADSALILTDPDVVHGMTDSGSLGLDTNAYFAVQPLSGTAGGATVTGVSDTDAQALAIRGVIGEENPTDATPAVSVAGYKKVTTLGDYVTLLMKMEGTGATFVDSSDSPKTLTASGSATQTTAQKKFGSQSAVFDGNGDYVTASTDAGFAFGTGAFTVDCWVYISTIGAGDHGIFSHGGSNVNFCLFYRSTGALSLYTNANFRITDATPLEAGQWYHVALVGNGGADGSRWIKLFKNGVQVGSTYTYNYNYSQQAVAAGANQSATFQGTNGYIDEVRVSKGIAVWESNFTPPTSEYVETLQVLALGNAETVLKVKNATTDLVTVTGAGGVGIGVVPSARLTLPAGTATAGTAPLKFTTGTLLTAPEAGTLEYLSGAFYIRGTEKLAWGAATEFVNSANAGYLDLDAATGIRLGAATSIPSDSDKLILGAGGDMTAWYDGTAGNVKTSDVAASDLLVTCGANKTLELVNHVYMDTNIGGALLVGNPGVTPGEVELVDEAAGATGVFTFGFAVDEGVHGGFEIQHDYAQGTDLVFHVHFHINDAPTGTDNVQWRITYLIARDGQTMNAAVTQDSADTPVTTQYASYRTDIYTIPGASLLIGDQLLFSLFRVAATGDAYAGECLLETAGIHYQVDTLGSRQIGTK